MGISVAVGPSAEPLSITEAKLHLRVDTDITADDSLIASLITAARQWIEQVYGCVLVAQTLDLSLDGFPRSDRIAIPRTPLISVSSVTYYDEDLSTSTVFSASNYQVDKASAPPVVVLKSGSSWPLDALRGSSGVVVRMKVGHAVPFTAATTDILTATAHPFANGDVVRVWNTGGALPTGLSAGTNYYVIAATTDTLSLSATSGGAAVEITATGSGSHFLGEVPEPIKAAMKLLVGQMYTHREPEVTGTIVSRVQFAVDALLAPYRLY